MATTTNYAWETPDDTDLVKDGAAAIRTLGSSVDTTTKALNPSTTLGDIEYRSSTANTNTRLSIGSTGNVLTVAGGVPTWAAPAGGGKVLQVVSAEYSTETDNSTTTYADTGLTATITPTLSTSKILCMVSLTMGKSGDNSNNAANVQILRGATSILENKQLFYTGTAIWNISQWATNILDSPATNSATTYKVQFKQWFNNGARVRANNDGSKSTIVLIEIGA
jgi:hypothetical protein